MNQYRSSPKSRDRGYRAAAMLTKVALKNAEKKRPEGWRKNKNAEKAFNEGYWQGLLAAHCLHALGLFPNIPDNKKQIMETGIPQ